VPTFHWFLPTSGDGDQVGAATVAVGAADHARAATLDYLTEVAEAAESAGFTAALTPVGAGCPDPWIVCSAVAARTERLRLLVAFRTGFALPTLLAVWFAPALVVFQDCGARRALATSLRAAMANWRPLAVYGLLLFFYGAVLPGMAIAIIAVVAPSEAALYVIALFIGVPYYLMFSAVQAISDYVAYRDIFHSGEGAPPQRPEPGTP